MIRDYTLLLIQCDIREISCRVSWMKINSFSLHLTGHAILSADFLMQHIKTLRPMIVINDQESPSSDSQAIYQIKNRCEISLHMSIWRKIETD